jgi:hypothetical protein
MRQQNEIVAGAVILQAEDLACIRTHHGPFPHAARWYNKIDALLFTRNDCSTKLYAGSADHFHARQDKP